MIHAVTFDFWQTLLADTPENLARATALRLDGVKAVLDQSGYAVAREALEAAYEASGQRLAGVWREHRDLPYREQVALFLDLVSPGLAGRLPFGRFEEAARAYIAPVLSYPPLPSPGAIESVNALASLGVVLAVVSNTGRTPGVILRQVLTRFGLLDRFRVTSFSDEVGLRKPDPEIFRLTLARVGVEPRHAVHVGDTPGEDIAGARAAGMRAIHFAADGRPASDADLVVHDLAALPAALATLR
ncbi:MAG: HAD family hydrolase [Candidatus Rokubacteria bacterium]|nr:HAD family hydrolase [Candidatus Rokubacteria bacterium]MBI4611540.1 HAD family hydrolase [Candidatus Rokubacteria bacterium]